MFTDKTSLIIPTKNRAKKIINLLDQIDEFKIFFDEIIIVDSSNEENKKTIQDYTLKKKIKLITSKPSISLQRNIGINNSSNLNKFIMFLDDDIVFEKNAFEEMNNAINKYPEIAGFSFNLNKKNDENLLEKLKKSNIVRKTGIYSSKPGLVLKNGWQTKIINICNDIEVQWLSTQAVVYKKNNINNLLFDENLGQYSYLEDLDFSYTISKKSKLMVVSKAKYTHPNFIERKDFDFGKKEIVNRFYFVKKNNLIKTFFFFSSIIKIIVDLLKILIGNFLLKKVAGNIYGLFICLIKK